MTDKNYQLVNPSIKGDFPTTFSASTPFEAANNAWKSLSSYFTNNVPKFPFTLQSLKDNKLFHFLVKEDVKGDQVNYKITELKLKDEQKANDTLKKNVQEFNKKYGGSRRRRRDRDEDEDDDDDDDDNDMYHRIAYPHLFGQQNPFSYLSHFYFDPTVYNLQSFYVPSFVVPYTPYVEIQLPIIR